MGIDQDIREAGKNSKITFPPEAIEAALNVVRMYEHLSSSTLTSYALLHPQLRRAQKEEYLEPLLVWVGSTMRDTDRFYHQRWYNTLPLHRGGKNQRIFYEALAQLAHLTGPNVMASVGLILMVMHHLGSTISEDNLKRLINSELESGRLILKDSKPTVKYTARIFRTYPTSTDTRKNPTTGILVGVKNTDTVFVPDAEVRELFLNYVESAPKRRHQRELAAEEAGITRTPVPVKKKAKRAKPSLPWIDDPYLRWERTVTLKDGSLNKTGRRVLSRAELALRHLSTRTEAEAMTYIQELRFSSEHYTTLTHKLGAMFWFTDKDGTYSSPLDPVEVLKHASEGFRRWWTTARENQYRLLCESGEWTQPSIEVYRQDMMDWNHEYTLEEMETNVDDGPRMTIEDIQKL